MGHEPQDGLSEDQTTLRTEGDDFSAAATATENTPLLGSETSSDWTLRDDDEDAAPPPPGSADDRRPSATAGQGGKDETIGFGRALAIILSMWCLIFLQGAASTTSCSPNVLLDWER